MNLLFIASEDDYILVETGNAKKKTPHFNVSEYLDI